MSCVCADRGRAPSASAMVGRTGRSGEHSRWCAGSYGSAWSGTLARSIAPGTTFARESPSRFIGRRPRSRVRRAGSSHAPPQVITVFGADQIDGRIGIWMELVHGRTLEALLQEHGPFSAREAASIGAELCAALAAVHRARLVHRDVKAQNVMRAAGGRLVLMDFGAGEEIVAAPKRNHAGTPVYMAPELFDGAPASPRSDIYSLGVLLFHIVTGEYPVNGATGAAVRDAHPRPPRGRRLIDLRPDLAAGVRASPWTVRSRAILDNAGKQPARWSLRCLGPSSRRAERPLQKARRSLRAGRRDRGWPRSALLAVITVGALALTLQRCGARGARCTRPRQEHRRPAAGQPLERSVAGLLRGRRD